MLNSQLKNDTVVAIITLCVVDMSGSIDIPVAWCIVMMVLVAAILADDVMGRRKRKDQS